MKARKKNLIEVIIEIIGWLFFSYWILIHVSTMVGNSFHLLFLIIVGGIIFNLFRAKRREQLREQLRKEMMEND